LQEQPFYSLSDGIDWGSERPELTSAVRSSKTHGAATWGRAAVQTMKSQFQDHPESGAKALKESQPGQIDRRRGGEQVSAFWNNSAFRTGRSFVGPTVGPTVSPTKRPSGLQNEI
jgi:hypothetical protein